MLYVAVAGRALIGVVFLVSAASKLSGRHAWRAFVRSARRLSVLPRRMAAPAAVAVVAAEAAVPLLLAVPLAAAGIAGFTLACGLLVAFAVAIVASLRRGDREPCRCFGRSAAPLGARHVYRNACLAGAALVAGAALYGPATGAAREAGSTRGLLLAAVAGLVAGGLVTVFDDLTELFFPTTRPIRQEATTDAVPRRVVRPHRAAVPAEPGADRRVGEAGP